MQVELISNKLQSFQDQVEARIARQGHDIGIRLDKLTEDNSLTYATLNSEVEKVKEIVDLQEARVEVYVSNAMQAAREEINKKIENEISTVNTKINDISEQVARYTELQKNVEGVVQKVNALHVLQSNNVVNENNVIRATNSMCRDSPINSEPVAENVNLDQGAYSRNSNIAQSVTTCQTTVNIDLPLPRFGGNENDDPLQYLDQLEEYFRLKNIPEGSKMFIVKKTIDARTLNWINMAMSQEQGFEYFRHIFTNKYWNTARQHKIRANLSYGQFHPHQNTSMADYILHFSQYLRHLRPRISDEDFIMLMTRHFPMKIQNYLLIAKPRTIIDMIDLVTALEGQDDERHQYQEPRGSGRRNHQDARYSPTDPARQNQAREQHARDRYQPSFPRTNSHYPRDQRRNNEHHINQMNFTPRPQYGNNRNWWQRDHRRGNHTRDDRRQSFTQQWEPRPSPPRNTNSPRNASPPRMPRNTETREERLHEIYVAPAAEAYLATQEFQNSRHNNTTSDSRTGN